MNKIFIFAIVLFFPLEIFAAEDSKKASEKGNKSLAEKQKTDFLLTTKVRADSILNDEYQSSNRKNEFKNNYLRIDVLSNATFKKNWIGYLNYRIQETPVQESEIVRRDALPNGGGDKTFENNYGLLREFYFGYDGDKIKVYGGKFRPTFAMAYRVGRGIWVEEVAANNYNPLEKLGGVVVLKAGNEKTVGKYDLGFGVFTNDRKNLDKTQFTNRDPILKSDGIPGDTRKPESYFTSLDVNYDFGNNEKLLYRFAYMNLAVNSNSLVDEIDASKIDDQKGMAATMKYQYPVSKNYNFDLLTEYVDMKNIDGNSDVSDKYLIANIINNIYDNWNITLGYGGKRQQYLGRNGQDEDMSEISAGYKFGKNYFFDSFTIQIGQRHYRTNNKISVDKVNSRGLMFRYIKSF